MRLNKPTPEELDARHLNGGEVAIWAAAYVKVLLEQHDASAAFRAGDHAVRALRHAYAYYTERKALGVFASSIAEGGVA